MKVAPISLREANAYVGSVHRHHGPVRGHKFAIAAIKKGIRAGVAIASRPVSRVLDNGMTLEITRVATDGTRNACSFLYGACARIAREMGYDSIITYTLKKESGSSLRAAGWIPDGEVKGRSWKTKGYSHLFRFDGAFQREDKIRWVRRLD